MWEAGQAGFAAGGEFCPRCPGQVAVRGWSWGCCHLSPGTPGTSEPRGVAAPGRLAGAGGLKGGLEGVIPQEVCRGLSHRGLEGVIPQGVWRELSHRELQPA